jgi:hypothetical protein
MVTPVNWLSQLVNGELLRGLAGIRLTWYTKAHEFDTQTFCIQLF